MSTAADFLKEATMAWWRDSDIERDGRVVGYIDCHEKSISYKRTIKEKVKKVRVYIAWLYAETEGSGDVLIGHAFRQPEMRRLLRQQKLRATSRGNALQMAKRLQEIGGWEHEFEAYIYSVGAKRKKRKRIIKLKDVRRLVDGRTVLKKLPLVAGDWADGLQPNTWIKFRGIAEEKKQGKGEYTIPRINRIRTAKDRHNEERYNMARALLKQQIEAIKNAAHIHRKTGLRNKEKAAVVCRVG